MLWHFEVTDAFSIADQIFSTIKSETLFITGLHPQLSSWAVFLPLVISCAIRLGFLRVAQFLVSSG